MNLVHDRREVGAAVVHHLAGQGLTHLGRQRRGARHAQVDLLVHHAHAPAAV